ncbi:IS66 family transposase [Dysosmobacter welbionis]|nr:transposase [Dysosmobacter welbionis]
MVQKFVMYAPLYRQEQEWNRAGVQLSRQTMSN